MTQLWDICATVRSMQWSVHLQTRNQKLVIGQGRVPPLPLSISVSDCERQDVMCDKVLGSSERQQPSTMFQTSSKPHMDQLSGSQPAGKDQDLSWE